MLMTDSPIKSLVSSAQQSVSHSVQDGIVSHSGTPLPNSLPRPVRDGVDPVVLAAVLDDAQMDSRSLDHPDVI
jgi:hypothetical protein